MIKKKRLRKRLSKTVKVIAVFLGLFAVFAIPSFAKGSSEDYWQDFLDTVPDGDSIGDMNSVVSGVGVESLLSEIISALRGSGGEVFSFFTMLLGIGVLLAVSECAGAFESCGVGRGASAAVSLIASLLVFSRIGAVARSVSESLRGLSAFFSALIPILTGILASGGNINSAAAQATNMNLALGAVSYVASELLLPLAFALFALALASGIDSGAVSSLAKGIRGVFMWVLGIGTTVMIAAVSMQSIISGAQDSAYLRAAKYAATGMIPVVGSTVSAALGTLVGGLGYVKSAVGVSAVVIIIGLALSPLITLLLYRLSFTLVISFLEFAGASGGVRSLSAFRSAFDALISVYALSAVVYISEIVVFMKSGVTVFG